MNEPAKAVPERVGLLDAWRGVAVLVMICWHFRWDLGMVGLAPQEPMQAGVWLGLRYFIVYSFVLLAGISSRYTRNGLRRGLITLGCALAVTAATWAAGQPAWFGILHMLGSCMLLYALLGERFRRLPEIPALIACLVLFGVTHEICYTVRVSVPGLWIIGLRTRAFESSDYYPLIPWAFLFLAGTVLGGKIRESNAAWKQRKAPAFLTWIGRHALLIYMVHQPVLLGIAALLPRLAETT